MDTELVKYLQPTLQYIATELKLELQELLMKKGKLKSSGGLVKSIDFKIDNSTLSLIAEDYFNYYANGRRAGARKVPISALLKWIKRYKIKGRGKNGQFVSDNSLAFAIQNSIYRKGVKSKGWVYGWLDDAAKLTEDLIGEKTLEYYAQLIEDKTKKEVIIEIK